MISIIDYGLGNIRAFANAFKRMNIPCSIANKTDDLENTSKIILSGVGAFDHAMEKLEKSGMRARLDELVLERSIPVLGICVGMQILAKSSEEGTLPGLGWMEGVVKKIDASKVAHQTHLPHMGWNTVDQTRSNSLFNDIENESRFYFLHSYYFQCMNNEDSIAESDYGGRFSCAVNSDNIYGVQFHPEKSHQNGITLLKNFGKL